MSAARWARLHNDLSAAGIEANLDTRSYPGGVSRSIHYHLADGGSVEVHDKWWHENWTGWEVHVEGHDSIVQRGWPRTKKRSEVVAAFLEAVKR